MSKAENAPVRLKILFTCLANSVRSQMAEGLARKILGADVDVQSVGIIQEYVARSKVHPDAIKAMAEIGIDITKQYPKTFEDLPSRFFDGLNYMINLHEGGKFIPADQELIQLTWPIKDPIVKKGTEEERLQCFREARDFLEGKINFFALSLKLSGRI